MYSPDVRIERDMPAEDYRALLDVMRHVNALKDVVERHDGEVIHTYVFGEFRDDKHLEMVADIHTMAAQKQNAMATTRATEDLRGKAGFEAKIPWRWIVITVEAFDPNYSVRRFHDDSLTIYNSHYPPRREDY